MISCEKKKNLEEGFARLVEDFPRFLHCMKMILFSYDTSTYLPENNSRILSALYLRLLDLDY